MGFSCVSVEKNPLANVGDTHLINHSGILAWEIPWTMELGGLQSTGSQRVGHNLVTKE